MINYNRIIINLKCVIDKVVFLFLLYGVFNFEVYKLEGMLNF